MGRDYFRSPEGEAAWKEIGKEYNEGQEEMYDKWYADYQKLTKNTKKEDYKIYIGQMKRFILKSGEFLWTLKHFNPKYIIYFFYAFKVSESVKSYLGGSRRFIIIT